MIIDCKYDCLAGKARERFVQRENLPLMKGSSVLLWTSSWPSLRLVCGLHTIQYFAIACFLIPFPGDDHTGVDGVVNASGKANRSFFF